MKAVSGFLISARLLEANLKPLIIVAVLFMAGSLRATDTNAPAVSIPKGAGAGYGPTTQVRKDDRCFFVSPQGNDRWTGALAEANEAQTNGPFATLERALQASRESRAAGRPSPVIMLRGGTYVLSKAIELTAADSGTVEHPLKLTAYPGERAVLDGGMRIRVPCGRSICRTCRARSRISS